MAFSQLIIRWYDQNKRNLPWRHTKDAYKIWLSEIIMQQTRVQQGLPYYEKFVKKFPTVHHLAKSNENTVIKVWQGLGYYSRARNLHASAKFISKKLKGKFPTEYHELKKLKGVGDYTAAAIASFAYNKPFPVVDGNVYRLLSRYSGIRIPIDSSSAKKQFTEKAGVLIDKENPGLFNQAIMEFGALQCVPQNPNCALCPLKKDCYAHSKDLVESFPVKSKKTKIRKRYFNYLVLNQNNKILIRKRTENDIWKNLYDFPLIETNKPISQDQLQKMVAGKNSLPVGLRDFLQNNSFFVKSGSTFKHILSHQVIFAKFWEMKLPAKETPVLSSKNKNIAYMHENQTTKFAFSRLIEKYLAEKNITP